MTLRTDDLIRRIRGQILGAGSANPSAAAMPSASSNLRGSAALKALNRGWILEPSGEIRSHRPWLGPWIVAGKRVLRRFVLAVLQPYFDQERELFREMVRFSNEAAECCDRLGAEIEARDRALRAEIDALRDRDAPDKRNP